MRQWTNRDELIAAVAYALGQLRPLLRRIVNEKTLIPRALSIPPRQRPRGSSSTWSGRGTK
jgi:hypothetical protein